MFSLQPTCSTWVAAGTHDTDELRAAQHEDPQRLGPRLADLTRFGRIGMNGWGAVMSAAATQGTKEGRIPPSGIMSMLLQDRSYIQHPAKRTRIANVAK